MLDQKTIDEQRKRRMSMTPIDERDGFEQALAKIAGVIELYEAWESLIEDRAEAVCIDGEVLESQDDVIRRADEYPLSFEVRSHLWRSSQDYPQQTPDQCRFVLSTGGPHTEVRYEVDLTGSITEPVMWFSDWWTTLNEVPLSDRESEAFLWFGRSVAGEIIAADLPIG